MGKLRRILGFLSFLAIVFFGTNSFAGGGEACQAGLYYEADTQTLETCPAGYYCPEGIGEYEEGQSTDACKIPCSEMGDFYTASEGDGLSTPDYCYGEITLNKNGRSGDINGEGESEPSSFKCYYSGIHGAGCSLELPASYLGATGWSYDTNCATQFTSLGTELEDLKADQLPVTLYACPSQNKITCNAGTYYNASTQSCATCTAGSYCTGGTFDKTSVNQGITACPGDFTDGGSGLSSEDQCVFTLQPGTMIDTCDYFTVSVIETCATDNNYFCPGYSVTVGDVDPANNITWCSDYGYYKCPENSTTHGSYCTCNTGYFGWSGGVSGDKLDRLTSSTHTCMEASYYCEQGTYLPAGQTTCATCPAGSYCIGDTYAYDASNDSGIEACPEGYTSGGGAGSEDDCSPEIYYVPFYCNDSKTTIIETQDVVFGGNIYGQPASVAQAKCDKPGYHVINYVCSNLEVMPGSTATYVSPFTEECVAEWGANNYFITIDYNTPVPCTDAELCGTFVGKEVPALTVGDAQYKATKDISVQYNGTLAAVPIEYQQRKGYELVYYVPYPEDVTIFLDPNNESGATSMLWTVEDGDTGEYVSTTKWTYDGENNTSIKYYPMWRAKTITCDNGGYLPAGSETCEICPAGSYCDGGTFEYSDTTDQGKYPCPAFPYNNSGEGNGSQELCYAYCKDLADYYSGGIVYSWKSNRVEEECAKETYDVTFKCNGTTVSTSSVQYDGYITMPSVDACNTTGYYVSDWVETSALASGAPGASIGWTWTDKEVQDIVFNANLVPYTLTISYDAGKGNGSAPVTPTTCTYADKDAACFAPASTFTPPAGYVFSHWVVTEDGAADGGYLGTTFNPGADMAYMVDDMSLSIILQAVYEISDEAISCGAGSYLPKGGLTTSDCKVCDSGSYCTGGAWRYSDTTDQGITICPYIFTDGSEGYTAAEECTAYAIEGQYIVYDKSNTDAPFRTVNAMTAGYTSSYYPTGALTYEQALVDIENSSLGTVTWFKENCPANSKNTAYAPYCTCNADYVSSSTDAERKSLNAVIEGETCALAPITCPAYGYLPAGATECDQCKPGYYCPSTEMTYTYNETQDQGLTVCPAGSYCTGIDGQKHACPMSFTSKEKNESQDNCYYTLLAGQQFTYDSSGDIMDCDTTYGTSYCPGGTYTWFAVQTGTTGQKSCPYYSTTNSNTDGCVCNNGYTVDGLAEGGKNVTSVENGTCQVVQCTAGYRYIPAENKNYLCDINHYCPGTGDAISTYDEEYEDSCILECPEDFPESEEGAQRLGACYKTCPEGSMSTVATPENPNACEEQQIYYVHFYCSEEDKDNKTNEAARYDVTFGSELEMPASSTCANKTGYVLTGWRCDTWGTHDAGVQTNTAYTAADADYCAAVWEPNTLTISYNVGDGALPVEAPTTCQYGDTACVAPTPVAPTGYVFNEWNMSSESGDIKGEIIAPGDDLTKWIANGDEVMILTATYVKLTQTVQCESGYFLPAYSDSVDDCELCRNSGYCVGGEYELNSTVDQGIEGCPEPYVVSEPGAENIGKCYTIHTEACTNPCGSASYCYTCPNDNFSSCAYDTTATVTVKDFYSGETEVIGDETCPIKYSNLTMCKPTYYLDESAKDCSKLCTSLPGSCQNANGDSVQCWNMSTVATLSAGANACYGAGCAPTCNLSNDYVLGTDGKLTGEYVNHCPEHATCTESYSANEGYRWYPNTICTPTTFCSFTYTCDAGYVASTTGNIEYGYSRTLYGNPMTATTIASCDPGVFKVTLDANGGTGGTTTMYQKYTVGWYSDESATNALKTITIPKRDRYTFTGYYINDVEVVDIDGIVNPGASNLFTSDGVITAQWSAKSITCGAGYYYDYANMVCAECQSPYYCPGGTFDMTVDSGTGSDLGKKDCKIDAFPYYAIANADKVFSDAKADDITKCYIKIPAGKQINANWGLEDLQSGWANDGNASYYYTGSIPGIRDYAIKCSEDRNPFINESPVGATSTYQCYGTITLNKNEGTGSLNGEDANSRTATVTCSFETLDVYGKCELPMTGITKKGAKLAGWSVNNKCTDNVSVEYLAGLIEKQLPLQLSACWESESITCEPGYYFDYDNQKCAECMSPYYCPGGTFNMDDVNADGRVDCRIDAFPYYAENIDASAIGAYRGAEAKTGCYVMLPAGKEIVSTDGRIADLRSGYFFNGGEVTWSAEVSDFAAYATKCSDDLGISFYEHSNVGAESYAECYGTITLNKSGASGLLYDQSNNVINGDSETAQSVEYKCYATGDDVSLCSLPKTTGLSREGWSIGGWGTTYGCTGTGQTQINLNNMTSGTDMYVCMSRNRITCDAGAYLPMGATTCSECEMGKYCPGGTFTYSESADNGLNQCPSIFIYGDTGTKSESECRTMAIEAQYIKYANGVFQIVQDDSDNEYCTGGTLTYGQAMTDVAKGENTWFKYQCPSNSSNTDGAPYCLCNENYTTSSDDATLIALNAAINGNMCLRNTCEAGTYMKNNECVVCPAGNVCSTDVPGNAPKTCSELTGGLYTLSAPGSSSIDACYTECEEYAITNGTAIPVEDTVFYPFKCEFTGRSQTGNPCDIVNGICIETSCNHNFELINGVCTPCARENAISYKQGGNCVIESCVSGFHPNGQVCEANVIECSAPNAIASTQKWDSNKNAFGECIITECADGYHLGSNTCQTNEQVCELEHGIGVREWNHNTNKWGECVATECDPGYTNDSSLTNEGWKQCGRCNNMYSANGELAVSSYVKGCEIASCMYQGELYNLENNECRLICDTYSDETGSRKWNASRKKCEHTCAPGYVTW